MQTMNYNMHQAIYILKKLPVPPSITEAIHVGKPAEIPAEGLPLNGCLFNNDLLVLPQELLLDVCFYGSTT